MTLLGINAKPVVANTKTNSTSPMKTIVPNFGVKIKATPQTDVFTPSAKPVDKVPVGRFANNYRINPTPNTVLDLDKMVKKGDELKVETYPNGSVKEKVLTNNKGMEYKQTYYENGKPESEVILQHTTAKTTTPHKETHFYPNGNLKDNSEYNYDAGKHLEQTFHKNGNVATEKVQNYGGFKWYDVRNTEFHENGKIKNNSEWDTNYGMHYTQTYNDKGELTSQKVW